MALYAFPPLRAGVLVASASQQDVSTYPEASATYRVKEGEAFSAEFAIENMREGETPVLGGPDAERFSFTRMVSGLWRLFMTGKRHNTPVDADKNNIYEVRIVAGATKIDVAVRVEVPPGVTSLPDMSEPSDSNFLEEARRHVTTQFQDKPVFDKHLQLLISPQDSIEEVFNDLLTKRTIEEARGHQLDIIGRIVGQSRETVIAALIDYFGFSPNLQAWAFGTVKNPAVGGRFRSLNENINTIRNLTDQEFRLFIKAKIIKNVGKATAEDVINSVKFILPDINYVYLTEGDAEFSISVDRSLSVTEALLITDSNIIPKPIGVKLHLHFTVGEAGWGNNWGLDWND